MWGLMVEFGGFCYGSSLDAASLHARAMQESIMHLTNENTALPERLQGGSRALLSSEGSRCPDSAVVEKELRVIRGRGLRAAPGGSRAAPGGSRAD